MTMEPRWTKVASIADNPARRRQCHSASAHEEWQTRTEPLVEQISAVGIDVVAAVVEAVAEGASAKREQNHIDL